MKRRPLFPKPRQLTQREMLAVSMEAQAALVTRNHELVKSLDKERQSVELLRNELMCRPPPSDLIEARLETAKAEEKVAELKLRIKTLLKRYRRRR